MLADWPIISLRYGERHWPFGRGIGELNPTLALNPQACQNRGWLPSMKSKPAATAFNLTVEFDRETDGRWIADIAALPGVTVYGRTQKQALARVEALASRVLADRDLP